MNKNQLRAAARRGLGEPLDNVHHQCHVASIRIVQSGELPEDARVARGTCQGVGGQHSWITLGNPYARNARIIDPTLWSYRDDVTGIWVGNAIRGWHRPHGAGSIWEYGRPAPPQNGNPVIQLTPRDPLSAEAREFLSMIEPLDRAGWHTLAHAPVGGWPAGEILAAMDDTEELAAIVPVDLLGMTTDRNPGGLYL